MLAEAEEVNILLRGAPSLFTLLFVPSSELITCFVEGNTANFSLMGPCVESKGCSLDDWEKNFGSHPIAGLEKGSEQQPGKCAVSGAWGTEDRAGDVAGAIPSGGDSTEPAVWLLQLPLLIRWATPSPLCP